MTYNVKDFGAVGDGKTLDTKAIQQAIDTCSNAGGGKVLLEKGTFLTGTLFLKSNVMFYLDVTALLLGSADPADYDEDVFFNLFVNETRMDRCLIYTYKAENVTICGEGMIDGQGYKTPKGFNPMLLRYKESKNITLRDLRLEAPASWTNSFIMCDTIKIDSIKVHSRANNNGDGNDFNSCTNVTISNCSYDCSDDCIVLHNSFPGYLCENIVVTNCIMKSQWAGVRIGLASRDEIRNVTISNCIFRDIECSGLKIQVSEGSVLRNMVFSNLVMQNVVRPIFITANYFKESVNGPDEITRNGGISDMIFSNIFAESQASSLKKVWFQDEPLVMPSCIIVDSTSDSYIRNITFDNIRYNIIDNGWKDYVQRDEIPSIADDRAEGFRYKGALPAYGFYLRNAENIDITNVRVNVAPEEKRSMVYTDNCKNIKIG